MVRKNLFRYCRLAAFLVYIVVLVYLVQVAAAFCLESGTDRVVPSKATVSQFR